MQENGDKILDITKNIQENDDFYDKKKRFIRMWFYISMNICS